MLRLVAACSLVHTALPFQAAPRSGTRRRTQRAATDSETPAFAAALDAALRGDATQLRAELANDVVWTHGLGEARGATDALKLINDAAEFFGDARLDCLTGDDASFRWLASGVQPVKWQPRVLVHGTTTLTRNAQGRVSRVEDAWDASAPDIGLQQVAPRFWDIFDLWATPVAERPCEEVLDAFLFGGGQARLVKTPPRMCLVCSVDDVSNSRAQRIASALPDFVFLQDTRSPTDVITATTTPLSVSIEALPRIADEARRRRVTWTLPLPSSLGLDQTKLPALPPIANLTDGGLELGVAENPSLTYALAPSKLYVCASYPGDSQDAAAAPLRKALAAAAGERGLALAPGPNGGASPLVLRKWRAKLGYSASGALAYAMESNAPGFVPIDGDELCVEVTE